MRLETQTRAVTEAFLRGLPKAELHVHLEGTLEPAMLLTLAKRNNIQLRFKTEEELRAAYNFSGLEHFLSLYFEGCRVLVQERDFYEVTRSYLNKAQEQNVRRAEVFLGPQTFLQAGTALSSIMNGVLRAMDDALWETGTSAGFIVSVHRHRPVEEALHLLDAIAPWKEQVVGIGMGGPEVGYPPGRFAPFFRKAKGLGFRTTVHAGEEGPATYIREALQELRPDRLDHGVTAVQDEQLVEELVMRQTPLTICPLSNARLGVVPTLQQHPLRTMLRRGLNISLHSDDPPYFGGYINENYVEAWKALDLSLNDVVAMAKNSFRAAFQPQQEIATNLQEVDLYEASFAEPNFHEERI